MGATHRFTRRLTISGGLAAVAAAPLVAAVLVAPASQSTYLGQCSSGEEGDAYTGQCVPYLVPNSPGGNPAAAPEKDVAASVNPKVNTAARILDALREHFAQDLPSRNA